jgi:ATP-dependent Clp protease ATP-binding subunit ClpX
VEHPPPPRTLEEIRRSFCNRRGDTVASVVCGPTPDIAICDECIELCREIIEEQQAGQPPGEVGPSDG